MHIAYVVLFVAAVALASLGLLVFAVPAAAGAYGIVLSRWTWRWHRRAIIGVILQNG